MQKAARLFGAAEIIRERLNSPVTVPERTEYDQNLSALRAQMDESTFSTAWDEGRAMTMEQAIMYALEQNP